MRILPQYSVQKNRAVSPVIAVILMVAVTVILSTAVGVLVFNLGGLTDPGPTAGVSVDEKAGGQYEVQLVDKQDADRVIIETDEQQQVLNQVGERASVDPFNGGRVNIFGEKNGERTLLTSYMSAGTWANYLGDASEGSLKVTGSNIVNDYTYLPSDVTEGSTEVTVNDASAFSAGDEVLFVQMQNSSGGEAGAYESHKVAEVSGNTLVLEAELKSGFASGEFTTRSTPIPASNPGTVTQAVRIPHYSDVTIDGGTITAPDWNGQTGGIVFFRATGTVEFMNGGSVDVSGTGFRGGLCGDCGDDWDGGRGEGINGWNYGGGEQHYADEVSLNNINGGGGSHVDDNNGGDPAAGGGYAESGGDAVDSQSSYDSEGGDAVGLENLAQMHFGGGGGAGSDNDNYTPYPESSHGGGIAIISAAEIVDANVHADGIDGKNAEHRYGAQSGGGAGGTVYLAADSITASSVTAYGGDAARDVEEDPDTGEISGEGGDGRIRVDANTLSGDVFPDPFHTDFSGDE